MSQPTHGKPKRLGRKPDSGPAAAESPDSASSGEGAGASSLPGVPAEQPLAVRAGKETRTDTMLIHGVSEDGQSFAVLRARDDRLEAGIVRKVKDGEPLHGELVRLTPRAESPLMCDVEVQYAPPSASTAGETSAEGPRAPRLTHGGPAQVATSSYRANWDAIWSKPAKASQPN